MISRIFLLYAERSGWFLELLGQHIAISAAAIGIAGAAGLLLGILISQKKTLAPYVLGTTNVVYTIPSISLLGLLIPWLGIGNTTAVTALTVYALLPMVRNTYTGLSNIAPETLEAAKGMGSTKLQMLLRIQLPLATPVIVAGLRNMVVMTIAISGVASFIGAGGLGVAIYRGITTNNPALTFAGSLLIALLALVCDALLGRFAKRLEYA